MGVRERVRTAILVLPLLAAAVALLPPPVFAALLGLVAAVGQWELYRFHFRERLPALAWAACAAGFVLVFMAKATALSVAAAVLFVLMVALLAHGPVERALADTSVVLLGLIYVAFLLMFVVLLQQAETFGRWVFYLMLITWAGDSTAFFVGSRWGRLPLTPISPKKTVEGTLAGIMGSILAAYVGWLFVPGMEFFDPLFIGVLLGMAALVGDLVESLFKRGAGVKDSSALIAGHGGMLDKLDAFLFTAPALYYYLAVWVWPLQAAAVHP